MAVPGFPSVTPFILWQGEKGGGVLTYVSTWPCPCQSSHGKVKRGGVLTYGSTWRCLCQSSYGKVRNGGGFNTCLYLAFPLSLHSSYRKVKRGSGFNKCLYLALPLSLILYLALPLSLISWQGEKGVVLTYVSNWLSLCHSIYLIAR